MRLAAVLIALATLGLAGPATAAAGVGLQATRAEVGWVSLRVTGPAGATVTITEAAPAGAQPVATVALPAAGTVALSHAAPWRCDRRVRRFVATVVGSGGAAATVATPSCRGRLALGRLPRRVRAGRVVVVRVIDRWRVGDVAGRACPPVPDRCADVRLAAGRRRATWRLRIARAGRLAVTLRGPAGDVVRRALLATPASRRLRVLATGDSMIQLVDNDLAARLHAAGPTRFRSDARISSGISKPFLFDWVALARQTARRMRPDVTVVFLGANDGYSFADAPCCGAAWVRAYARRARAMMVAYARGGAASVLWLLLPAPRSAAFRQVFVPVNRALRRAARGLREPVQLVDLGRTFTPGGRFRATMRWGGRTVAVRQADGVHLSAAGARIAASIVLARMRRDGLAGS
jgi:lysophospholipase L1-like esterase